jgi:hypothetical protein
MTSTNVHELAAPLAAPLAAVPATAAADDGAEATDPETTTDAPTTDVDDSGDDVAPESESAPAESDQSSSTFEIEVWANNWMAVYVDGGLIGEDSVPITTERERDADPDPDSTCEFLIVDAPADWASADFDDSGWANATEWSAADVSPKDGDDQISWDPAAQLIWGTDLEVDNTVLLRAIVS